jgi:hypothetical protein
MSQPISAAPFSCHRLTLLASITALCRFSKSAEKQTRP